MMTKEYFNQLIDKEVLRQSCTGIKRFFAIKATIHTMPSRASVYWIRKLQWHYCQKGRWNSYMYKKIQMKLVTDFSMCVSPEAEIGEGLHIPHPTGIVIGSATKIGKNCSIYQNVTIGGARIGDAVKRKQPMIGNDVIIFAGAMVLGEVEVNDNVILAANSVLLDNATHPGVYAGTPAKKVK